MRAGFRCRTPLGAPVSAAVVPVRQHYVSRAIRVHAPNELLPCGGMYIRCICISTYRIPGRGCNTAGDREPDCLAVGLAENSAATTQLGAQPNLYLDFVFSPSVFHDRYHSLTVSCSFYSSITLVTKQIFSPTETLNTYFLVCGNQNPNAPPKYLKLHLKVYNDFGVTGGILGFKYFANPQPRTNTFVKLFIRVLRTHSTAV